MKRGKRLSRSIYFLGSLYLHVREAVWEKYPWLWSSITPFFRLNKLRYKEDLLKLKEDPK
jgi:hypothetical protein